MDSSLPLPDGGCIPSKSGIDFIPGSISTISNPKVLIKGELLAPIQDSHGFQQLLKYRKYESEFLITSIGNTFFRTPC